MKKQRQPGGHDHGFLLGFVRDQFCQISNLAQQGEVIPIFSLCEGGERGLRGGRAIQEDVKPGKI